MARMASQSYTDEDTFSMAARAVFSPTEFSKRWRAVLGNLGSQNMDFKVAGTATGITALQMDIKVSGITMDIMRKALEQARQGRMHILAARAGSRPSHRAGRCARLTRRDDREYRVYLREEQRRQAGCSAPRMQADFHHGLPSKMAETLSGSRKDISTYAPRIITIKIPVEKIRDRTRRQGHPLDR